MYEIRGSGAAESCHGHATDALPWMTPPTQNAGGCIVPRAKAFDYLILFIPFSAPPFSCVISLLR